MKPVFVSLSLVALSWLPAASAEDQSAPGVWSGEGALSAGSTTGNTETTDLGLSVNLDRKTSLWSLGLEAASDYGESDGVKNKSRLFLASHLDRRINDRLFGFGTLRYEEDEFSGFAYRGFAGGGLGYELYTNDALNWDVRGGPGWRFDEADAVFDITTVPATLLTPAEKSTSFSAIGESAFSYTFNPSVSLSNDTKLVFAETSNQYENVIALNAKLNGKLSARMSYEARHNTDVPEGFENTDTITRVSIVYAIGD